MMKGRWGLVVVAAVGALLLAAGPSPTVMPRPPTSSAADGGTSSDGGFVLCEGPYALCTTAACAPVAGQPGLLSCGCQVQSGYSAGTKCQGPKETDAGRMVFSRYSLIRSYVACNNSRVWAWCLDVPCLVDADNPLQATATCSCLVTSSPKSTYVAVTDFDSPTACTSGIISSATVTDMLGISAFYQSALKIDPPHTIRILTADGGR